ncbi:MAG: hypothetical protein M3Z84_10725, partial [Actinomycetota bacterium]|nr:hypothetical protein [Actinomycetota bacterium]
MDRIRPARAPSHQCDTVGSHRVEHRSEVRIEDLSRGVNRVALRRAATSSLEPDGATKRTEALTDPNQAGIVPHEVDRDSGARHEQEVEWTVTTDLVGKVGPVR